MIEQLIAECQKLSKAVHGEETIVITAMFDKYQVVAGLPNNYSCKSIREGSNLRQTLMDIKTVLGDVFQQRIADRAVYIEKQQADLDKQRAELSELKNVINATAL